MGLCNKHSLACRHFYLIKLTNAVWLDSSRLEHMESIVSILCCFGAITFTCEVYAGSKDALMGHYYYILQTLKEHLYLAVLGLLC